jgi:hypothetical protein
MIGFTNKAVAHLSAAITAVATQISVHGLEYGAILSAYGDSVFLMLRGPVNRELIKVDIDASVWGGPLSNYLTVERGQGGTAAQAWPVGSMMFATTHEDHYTEIIQRGENRVIDYNPNQVLSPLYAGEKIYQDSPAGCERWWKSYNGADPYWDIITGQACGAETYTDIGWDYDILIPNVEDMVFTVYAKSGDGYVVNWNSDWATARNAVTGQEAHPTPGSGEIAAGVNVLGGPTYVIGRSFFEFDLTPLTSNGRSIEKIELDLVGSQGRNESDIMVCESGFTGDVALGDFDNFVAGDFLDAAFEMVLWDENTNPARNLLLLNILGKAYAIAGFGALVSFCVLEHAHDVLNVIGTGNHRNGLYFWDFGYTEPIRTPRLLITYTKTAVWTQHFDNTKWTVTTGSWDGSKWVHSGGSIVLTELGTWVDGYMPYKLRITFDGEATAWVEMLNTDGSGELFDGRNQIASGQELVIENYNGYNIDELAIYVTGNVTNIEFLEP